MRTHCSTWTSRLGGRGGKLMCSTWNISRLSLANAERSHSISQALALLLVHSASERWLRNLSLFHFQHCIGMPQTRQPTFPISANSTSQLCQSWALGPTVGAKPRISFHIRRFPLGFHNDPSQLAAAKSVPSLPPRENCTAFPPERFAPRGLSLVRQHRSV